MADNLTVEQRKKNIPKRKRNIQGGFILRGR